MLPRRLRAYTRLLKRRIVGEKAPPEYIARGWALGVFIGSVIPFGLQLILSIPLSFKLKVSKIGATLGTFITNPVTIIFIYPAQCWVGSRILGSPLTWQYLKVDVLKRLMEVNIFSADGWAILVDIGARVIGGFFMGGLLMGIILAPIAYMIVYRLVIFNRAVAEKIHSFHAHHHAVHAQNEHAKAAPAEGGAE